MEAGGEVLDVRVVEASYRRFKRAGACVTAGVEQVAPRRWAIHELVSSAKSSMTPSKANVADAVSRDDFARARCEGWTGVQTPASETMCIPAKSVGDFLYLVDEAALDLASCSPSWLAEPVRCVARCAGWC